MSAVEWVLLLMMARVIAIAVEHVLEEWVHGRLVSLVMGRGVMRGMLVVSHCC
jgi:hypothetical protein